MLHFFLQAEGKDKRKRKTKNWGVFGIAFRGVWLALPLIPPFACFLIASTLCPSPAFDPFLFPFHSFTCSPNNSVSSCLTFSLAQPPLSHSTHSPCHTHKIYQLPSIHFAMQKRCIHGSDWPAMSICKPYLHPVDLPQVKGLVGIIGRKKKAAGEEYGEGSENDDDDAFETSSVSVDPSSSRTASQSSLFFSCHRPCPLGVPHVIHHPAVFRSLPGSSPGM